MPTLRVRDLVAAVAGHRAAPLGAIAACFALAVAIQLSLPITHDVGWLLVATRHWLRGARVYEDDVIEVNPPMNLWLLAPAVAASGLTGVSEIAFLRFWLLALVTVALVLCDAVLGGVLGVRREPLRRWTLATIAFAFLIPLGRHFGQREHEMAILFAPYVLAVGARRAAAALPPLLAALCGALAGVAVAIKPHYLLLPAALEAWIALRRCTPRVALRPETAALAATVVAYALAIAVWVPGYLRVVLPLARDAYWAYQGVLPLLHPLDLFLLAAAGAAVFRARSDPARAALACSWLLAAAAAYVAHLLQQTGWPYNRIVFHTAIIASLALALWPEPSPRATPRVPAAVAAVLGALLAAALGLGLPIGAGEALRTGAVWRRGLTTGMVGSLARVIREHGAGGPVVFLSTRVEWGFPAVNYAGVDWSSRFSSLWPLAAVIRGRATGEGPPPGRLRELERYVAASLAADFERDPPQLVFVDQRNPFGSPGAPVDLVAMLSRHPGFARAWSEYELLRPLGPYRIYRRTGRAGDRRAALGIGTPASRASPFHRSQRHGRFGGGASLSRSRSSAAQRA